jgi:tRNA threonylcarbamoyladenosine biosynthesis protein TsaB
VVERRLKVLAIDTAGPVIGVALGDGVEALSRTERVARGSETRIVPWVLALCAEAGWRISDLDGIAVARGPGAFTGIRVGLATAMGLALAAGLPVWGAMSLEPRARRWTGQPVLSMLDARKGRVYAAYYACDGSLVAGPADIEPHAVLAWPLSPQTLATGEGALLLQEALARRGLSLAPSPDDPAVETLAGMGQSAFAGGLGGDIEAMAPLYLREPDAVPPGAR